MKRLYFIGGTMGVGKTTACKLLKTKLDKCVFLDGDWCWDMHPFQVTESTKAMVTDNICCLLNNFIACPDFENIVFCWVMHEQSIIDGILSRLCLNGYEVINISLVCSEEVLRKRLQRDVDRGIRTPDIIERSASRIPLYEKLNTLKLDTSSLGTEETVAEILRISGVSSHP